MKFSTAILKLSTIIVILAGIYLALPFFFGMTAQRYAYRFLQNENKTLGNVLGVHLEFAQYNRGWFRSTAILQIEKRAANGDFEIIKSIPITIKHGPSYRVGNRYGTGLAMVSSDDLPLANNLPYNITFRDNIGFEGERGAFVLFSNKKGSVANDLQIGSLILHVKSNLKADQFLFSLDGTGLHFQDPQQSIAASVQHLQSSLQANYLGERNWELTLGLELGKNQLTAALPGSASTTMSLNTDLIDLNGVHFNTQKMAKLLGEVIELKQATNAQQTVKPTAWMALLQQFLTEMIHSNTWVDIRGLSITTPMGQLHGNYDVSFPTLSSPHDYFDVVTRNVGALHITVPHWSYTNAQATDTFALNNFQYDEYNNTVFSRRSKMVFDEFDVKNGQPIAGTAPMALSATGFSYQGELYGDVKDLSQTMQWQLGKLCFSNDCVNQIHGKLDLLKMNYDAFRGIAAATQQVVQYNPNQSIPIATRWMDLANAYAKLVSPETEVIISHDMSTSEGNVELHGDLSWPKLDSTATVPPTVATLMDQAVYEFHLLFPAAYVNAFLDQQAALSAPARVKANLSPIPSATMHAKAEPTFEIQAAQFLQYALAQGYLKKVGNTYVMDLTGKGNVVTINGTPWKMPT